MAPKKDDKTNKKTQEKSSHIKTCGTKSPGPKYDLKPLVGYKDHCHSKYRNPAYTIGKVQKDKAPCIGPGPKYLYKLPGIPGYSFPRAVYRPIKDCSPGPKYDLPGYWAPAFTLVGRRPPKCSPGSSGPYPPYPLPKGPAFTMTGRPKDRKCEFSPPIGDVGNVSLIKPSSPAFTIVHKPFRKDVCNSPGPKYFPALDKNAPAYTFGLKHSECSFNPRTECDEMC